MHSFKLLFLLSIFLLQSCIHFVREPRNERTFEASRELIWESIIKTFKPYPIEESSEKKGVLKTEKIYTGQIWKSVKREKTSGMLYTLSAHLYLIEQGRFRVVIIKETQKQKDFFSKSSYVPSDLMEEDELLYRIQREIKIKRLTDKLKRQNL